MAKRKNGEGSWGEKTIKGDKYKYFRDANGKYFYGKSTVEIKKKIEKYEKSQVSMITNLTTVGEYAEYWLTTKKSKIKKKTYDGYEYITEQALYAKNGFDLGNAQLRNVNKRQLSMFFDGLAEVLARSTIVKTKALLNQIFTLAKKEGLIADNFINEIELPIEENIVKKTKEISFLTDKDMEELTKEADRKFSNGAYLYGNNAKALIFIMNTGLRKGELIALKWKDIDLKNKTISVNQSQSIIKNRSDNQEKHYMTDTTSPKTKAGRRTIPLSNKAVEIILYFEKLNKNRTDNDYVFVNKNLKSLNPSTLYRTLQDMFSRADCSTTCSVHGLRHSFGSKLIRNGIDIKVVSSLLGHSKISTTYDIYIHVLNEQKVSAINIFNE